MLINSHKFVCANKFPELYKYPIFSRPSQTIIFHKLVFPIKMQIGNTLSQFLPFCRKVCTNSNEFSGCPVFWVFLQFSAFMQQQKAVKKCIKFFMRNSFFLFADWHCLHLGYDIESAWKSSCKWDLSVYWRWEGGERCWNSFLLKKKWILMKIVDGGLEPVTIKAII